MVTAAMKLKRVVPWKTSYDKPRQHVKKQRHRFAGKDPYSQSYVFSSNYVQISELDHKDLNPKELMLLNYGAGEDP